MKISLRATVVTASLICLPALAGAQHAGHGQQATDSTKKAAHEMGMMGSMEKMHAMMAQMSPWAELNAFHMLLAQSYHPAQKDSLQPLRQNASAMARAASDWAASTPPEACRSDEMTKGVAAIAASSKELDAKVTSGGSDADLKTALAAVHTQFEAVGMKCMKHDMKDMKH